MNREKYLIKKIINLAQKTPYSIIDLLKLTETITEIASAEQTDLLGALDRSRRAVKHGCTECGCVILADTEDWGPLCYEHYHEFLDVIGKINETIRS